MSLLQAHVDYMCLRNDLLGNTEPIVGHLEFILHFSTFTEPSPQEMLEIIKPVFLERMGGRESDWSINYNDVNEYGDHSYSFEWQHINNKDRSCPLMRTRTFRAHSDRIDIKL